MSMHLVGPYMSTTKFSGKGKRKPNTEAQRKSDAEHDAWLRKRGLHPDQRPLRDAMMKARGAKQINRIPDYREGIRSTAPLSNAVGNGFKTGVMENLHKEKPDVQKAILDKAKRVEVAYNKGPAMYITPGTDVTMLGNKSRRG